jgi:hypothetical protein
VNKNLKCPVCGKPLTQVEYDKALGLWKDKQEHIRHLETERRKLEQQQLLFKRQAKQQEKEFRERHERLLRETRKALAEQQKQSAENLRKQRIEMEKSFGQKMKTEIRKGVEAGIEVQKKELKRREVEFRKSKNKMAQLENSLKISADKYQKANEEISRLREQIQKGITPQIEGLLEEGKLLEKLRELFPDDRFEHPGKGGDIIQIIIERRGEIGRIVYECKKVKHFDKKHVDQAREARRSRQADFAVLVTNAFPAKRQYYFVEKTVFVISPVSLEPITYTLRESLVKIALLKMTNAAKERAVQRVYDFLSSNEYQTKVNDIAGQLLELGRELKSEMASHKRIWTKRYHIYRSVFNDVGTIDTRLKELAHARLEARPKMLPEPGRSFVQIQELDL